MTSSGRLIDHMRGVRYGEVLPIFLRDDGLHAEVYGTQMLNDCPQELWEKLDADAIAKEMGYSLADLIGAEVKAARAPAVAKYRHPENAALTWSSRGRKPQWFADHINSGKEPSDLSV
mgnify:CR=1 FL=1